jgi:hypothetical protein
MAVQDGQGLIGAAGSRVLREGIEKRFFDVACGFLEFAISSVCPLSARYFLSPAKGGSLPPPGTHMMDIAFRWTEHIMHVSAWFPPFGGTKKMCGPAAHGTQKRRQTLMEAIPLSVSKSQNYQTRRDQEAFSTSLERPPVQILPDC